MVVEGKLSPSRDWRYYMKKVDVIRVVTQDKEFLISLRQAENLKSALADSSHKDKMVFIEGEGVRLFSIRSLLKTKVSFCSLPVALQKRLVMEEGVFAEDLDGFSEDIKLRLSGQELGSGERGQTF